MHRFSFYMLQIVLILSMPLLAGETLAAKPAVKVIVAEVVTAPFSDRIEALGTLTANESLALTATVTETVRTIHFDDGDRVKKGQVLIELTNDEERALLVEARATVNEARRQHQRVQSLESSGTAAKSLLDQRHREWQTARARLVAIESRLADRLIKAPFSGVVGLRDISVGALVKPGDLITTLDDDSVMKLEFPVPSTYLNSLHADLPVSATTRAYGTREFTGKVKSVGSRVDPVTRSIRVRALLPNEGRDLKPGMLMQVALLKASREALLIPEEALLPKGNKQFVFVVDTHNENTISKREIVIGGRRPGQVEVVSGLEKGEIVVTHGTLKIRAGSKVEIALTDDGVTPTQELLQSLRKNGPPK